MLNFPLHPTITSTQSNFVIHTFWKIQFNSHSFSYVSFASLGFGDQKLTSSSEDDGDNGNINIL
jgi:hypothetical protein